MTEIEQDAFEEGYKAAWQSIYKHACSELNTGKEGSLNAERLAIITCLRNLCRMYGDNEWSDNMHLVDIIEKHLFKHFQDKL